MAPSMRSLNTNAVMTSTPVSSLPCGKKTRAPALTPRVPTSVTASGLIPSLMKRLTNGASMTPCQKLLNLSNIVRGGYRERLGVDRPDRRTVGARSQSGYRTREPP